MKTCDLLFIIEHFLPVIGGLENSTHRLATHLTKLGCNITLITTTPLTCDAHENTAYRVIREPISSIDFVRNALGSLPQARFDASIIFGVGHDESLRHWHTILSPWMPPAFLKVGSDGDLNRPYINPVLLQRFDGILCQTEKIASEAKVLGVNPGKVFPISNGLNINEWRANLPSRAEARRELKIPSNAFVVLVVARLVGRKRVDLAINAWEAFAQDNGSAFLIIHGSDFNQDDGCEAEIVAQANCSPYGSRILLLSPKIANSKSFAAADVLLSMSERDGAPNIFVEGLATGLPLIASALPGHQQYITDSENGFIIQQSDISTAGGVSTN